MNMAIQVFHCYYKSISHTLKKFIFITDNLFKVLLNFNIKYYFNFSGHERRSATWMFYPVYFNHFNKIKAILNLHCMKIHWYMYMSCFY